MVRLYDADGGGLIAELTDHQFEFLAGQLEAESLDDQDYYITPDTVDLLEEAGGDTELVETLRDAVGAREGMDVRWERG